MEAVNIELPPIQLIGLRCSTSNHIEANPKTAKIPSLFQKYFSEQSSEKIPNRSIPGTTYSVYTNYESDFRGNYTYFLGEQVISLKEIPEGFSQLIIPAQNYRKFTVGPGEIPGICIRAWQKIWSMEELNKRRSYVADFEIYDKRAADLLHTTLDIYIGIK